MMARKIEKTKEKKKREREEMRMNWKSELGGKTLSTYDSLEG